jgi:hypothetical protein
LWKGGKGEDGKDGKGGEEMAEREVAEKAGREARRWRKGGAAEGGESEWNPRSAKGEGTVASRFPLP